MLFPTFLLVLLFTACGSSTAPAAESDKGVVLSELNPALENPLTETALEAETSVINEASTENGQYAGEDVSPEGNYNAQSCKVGNTIYLGGYGNIYQLNSQTGEVENTIITAPHLLGAAAYQDYIYFIESTVDENGFSSSLMRINQDGTGKETLRKLDPGCYDVKVHGQSLSIALQTISDDALRNLILHYDIDESVNLTGEGSFAEDNYGIPKDTEGNTLEFLVDPLFSFSRYGAVYQYFQSESSVNVRIQTADGDILEKELKGALPPLVMNGNLAGYDEQEQLLYLYLPDEDSFISLFETSGSEKIKLLNCDDEWIYFGIYENEDITNMAIYRVSITDKEANLLFETAGTQIYYFSVYGNACYYGIEDVEGSHWVRRDMDTPDEIKNYPVR